MREVGLVAIPGIPDIGPGADVPEILCAAIAAAGVRPRTGDALVVAQKIISKAEGAVVDLAAVTPGDEARRLAEDGRKDPRLVEVILRESVRVVRAHAGVLITEHRLGFVSANAGVDHSNVGLGAEVVALLPKDPDASAAAIAVALRRRFDADVAVVLSDSHGRPHREGAVGVAIGVAGFAPLRSLIGRSDRYGYSMRTSTEAVADEIASAATLLQGQCDEGMPAVLVRGLGLPHASGTIRELIRDPARDLFR